MRGYCLKRWFASLVGMLWDQGWAAGSQCRDPGRRRAQASLVVLGSKAGGYAVRPSVQVQPVGLQVLWDR